MRIYLSSAESGHNSEILSSVDGVSNVLVSYYYLRSKKHEYVIECLEKFKNKGCSIMLDSGAHSFLNEVDSQEAGRKGMAQKKMTKTTISPEEYFERYLIFVEKYKEYFEFIVELDIDLIVGYDKVVEWQERLIKVVGDVKKLVFVYHPTIPKAFQEVEKWFKLGVVVGIGSFPSAAIHRIIFSIGLKYKGRIHGFAMTKNEWMKAYPWFSVDSSSWNAGVRFGQVALFFKDKGTLRMFKVQNLYRNKDLLKKFRDEIFPRISDNVYVADLLDFTTGRIKDSKQLDRISADSFVRLEKFLTSAWARKGIVY